MTVSFSVQILLVKKITSFLGVFQQPANDNYNGYEVIVDPQGTVTTLPNEKYYMPACLNVLHELMHVEENFLLYETTVKIQHASLHNEIGPTLVSIILQDEVYKRINDIPISEEVYYEEEIPADFGESINIGLVANTFRGLLEKYGSIYRALMSAEGRTFVRKYYHA